jgi:hypothetical protein
MLSIIFTIDYEIFGNGSGNLKQHVFNPMEVFHTLMTENKMKYVNFVEVAELIKISEAKSDAYINRVESQIKKIYESGNEIALHIHPQWFEAKFINGTWVLNYNDYNLAKMNEDRINRYIVRGIDYLKKILADNSYAPKSFRAGNWLIQPSNKIAKILHKNDIEIDSSVFRGGRQRFHGLNFTTVPDNSWWRFTENIEKAEYNGNILELPIFSIMKPFWHQITEKKISVYKSALKNKINNYNNSYYKKICDLSDKIRFYYPVKFDICKMNCNELINFTKNAEYYSKSKNSFIPLVAIGHTKNMNDMNEIKKFIEYIKEQKIKTLTLVETANKIKGLDNE